MLLCQYCIHYTFGDLPVFFQTVRKALEELFDSGEVIRSDLVISTKLFDGGNGVNDRGLSRKHIVEGMQAALERMKLTYVDLVFCHRPDVTTPMEETVRAMNHIIDRGAWTQDARCCMIVMMKGVVALWGLKHFHTFPIISTSCLFVQFFL